MKKLYEEFLKTVNPFNILPKEELENLSSVITQVNYLKNVTLFVQNKTKLNYVYVIFKGSLCRFTLENEKKILRTILKRGDTFGGVSILFNKGIALQTVQTLEDTVLFRIPKEEFLRICHSYYKFMDFFTQEFNRVMHKKPLVEVITSDIAFEEETPTFLAQSLENITLSSPVFCSSSTSVKEAALMMTTKRSDCLIITQSDDVVGILTDHDFREKIIAQDRPHHTSVNEIFSSPLITVSIDSQIFDAMLIMMQHNIKYLPVVDRDFKIIGVLTEKDLLLAQGESPIFMIRDINRASSIESIKLTYKKHLPTMIKNFINRGAKAIHLNRIITSISDTILKKVFEFVLKTLGEPPVKFVFMVVGSEGRKEQTLKTDQDNAIIFEDVPSYKEKGIKEYFLRLGGYVCKYLNEIGFEYCKFNIMAQNPKWCQPLKVWKEYFNSWIHSGDAEDILQSCIFFDFRAGYGNKDLIDELRNFLFEKIKGRVGFLRHLAENTLHFKPPLDFFGNFVLQEYNGQKDVLDLKSPMRIIVDFARIYALKNQIDTTNTLERLKELTLKGELKEVDYEELKHAYSFMMQIRLSQQVKSLEKNIPPSNAINPKQLPQIEQEALKVAFKRIKTAQDKLKVDFGHYLF